MHHPYKAAPFYIMLPINTQPQKFLLSISTLPKKNDVPKVAPSKTEDFSKAIEIIRNRPRLIIKAGGGTRDHYLAVRQLSGLLGIPVVLSPGSTGVLEDSDRLNMHVGGSKGSISGNFAMENADGVIMIGSRAVCQADCSGIGYPKASEVINLSLIHI